MTPDQPEPGQPTSNPTYQLLVALEATGRAERDARMWRARFEAVTDVPGAVQQLVTENDRLRAEMEGNRDTISSLLRDGADVWRGISESLVKDGRWVWEYAHADHEGFDPSREDTEWTTDRPGSECAAKGCVRRRHWIGPPEPTTSREARTEEADRV